MLDFSSMSPRSSRTQSQPDQHNIPELNRTIWQDCSRLIPASSLLTRSIFEWLKHQMEAYLSATLRNFKPDTLISHARNSGSCTVWHKFRIPNLWVARCVPSKLMDMGLDRPQERIWRPVMFWDSHNTYRNSSMFQLVGAVVVKFTGSEVRRMIFGPVCDVLARVDPDLTWECSSLDQHPGSMIYKRSKISKKDPQAVFVLIPQERDPYYVFINSGVKPHFCQRLSTLEVSSPAGWLLKFTTKL